MNRVHFSNRLTASLFYVLLIATAGTMVNVNAMREKVVDFKKFEDAAQKFKTQETFKRALESQFRQHSAEEFQRFIASENFKNFKNQEFKNATIEFMADKIGAVKGVFLTSDTQAQAKAWSTFFASPEFDKFDKTTQEKIANAFIDQASKKQRGDQIKILESLREKVGDLRTGTNGKLNAFYNVFALMARAEAKLNADGKAIAPNDDLIKNISIALDEKNRAKLKNLSNGPEIISTLGETLPALIKNTLEKSRITQTNEAGALLERVLKIKMVEQNKKASGFEADPKSLDYALAQIAISRPKSENVQILDFYMTQLEQRKLKEPALESILKQNKQSIAVWEEFFKKIKESKYKKLFYPHYLDAFIEESNQKPRSKPAKTWLKIISSPDFLNSTEAKNKAIFVDAFLENTQKRDPSADEWLAIISSPELRTAAVAVPDIQQRFADAFITKYTSKKNLERHLALRKIIAQLEKTSNTISNTDFLDSFYTLFPLMSRLNVEYSEFLTRTNFESILKLTTIALDPTNISALSILRVPPGSEKIKPLVSIIPTFIEHIINNSITSWSLLQKSDLKTNIRTLIQTLIKHISQELSRAETGLLPKEQSQLTESLLETLTKLYKNKEANLFLKTEISYDQTLAKNILQKIKELEPTSKMAQFFSAYQELYGKKSKPKEGTIDSFESATQNLELTLNKLIELQEKLKTESDVSTTSDIGMEQQKTINASVDSFNNLSFSFTGKETDMPGKIAQALESLNASIKEMSEKLKTSGISQGDLFEIEKALAEKQKAGVEAFIAIKDPNTINSETIKTVIETLDILRDNHIKPIEETLDLLQKIVDKIANKNQLLEEIKPFLEKLKKDIPQDNTALSQKINDISEAVLHADELKISEDILNNKRQLSSIKPEEMSWLIYGLLRSARLAPDQAARQIAQEKIVTPAPNIIRTVFTYTKEQLDAAAPYIKNFLKAIGDFSAKTTGTDQAKQEQVTKLLNASLDPGATSKAKESGLLDDLNTFRYNQLTRLKDFDTLNATGRNQLAEALAFAWNSISKMPESAASKKQFVDIFNNTLERFLQKSIQGKNDITLLLQVKEKTSDILKKSINEKLGEYIEKLSPKEANEQIAIIIDFAKDPNISAEAVAGALAKINPANTQAVLKSLALIPAERALHERVARFINVFENRAEFIDNLINLKKAVQNERYKTKTAPSILENTLIDKLIAITDARPEKENLIKVFADADVQTRIQIDALKLVDIMQKKDVAIQTIILSELAKNATLKEKIQTFLQKELEDKTNDAKLKYLEPFEKDAGENFKTIILEEKAEIEKALKAEVEKKAAEEAKLAQEEAQRLAAGAKKAEELAAAEKEKAAWETAATIAENIGKALANKNWETVKTELNNITAETMKHIGSGTIFQAAIDLMNATGKNQTETAEHAKAGRDMLTKLSGMSDKPEVAQRMLDAQIGLGLDAVTKKLAATPENTDFKILRDTMLGHVNAEMLATQEPSRITMFLNDLSAAARTAATESSLTKMATLLTNMIKIQNLNQTTRTAILNAANNFYSTPQETSQAAITKTKKEELLAELKAEIDKNMPAANAPKPAPAN